MALIIRDAKLDDAEAISRVHVAAWRAAYRGMMPDAYLDSLDPAVRAAKWLGVIGKDASDRRIFVAIDESEIVGFAGIGPARDEAGTRGELYMINLAPSAWGKGIGSALLKRSTSALAALDHREAILWVVRQNARARRFYTREGWSQEGDRRDTITENGFTFDIDELRYVRALPDQRFPA